MHPEKKWLLLLIVLGLFFSFILLEVGLRVLYYFGTHRFLLPPLRSTITWQGGNNINKFLLTSNSEGWFVTPTHEYFNWVQSNNDGLYDSYHSVEKLNNTYRILFLGDSFVQSLQTPLQQTFFKQLEQSLNSQNLPKKVEVISLGLGDTGTAQQYLALKEIGLKYQPDLVVQMFLTANDLKNNNPNLQNDPHRPYFKLDQNGHLVEEPFIENRSRSSFLKVLLKGLRTTELVLTIRQSIQERLLNQKVDYPLDYHVYDKTYSQGYKESWLLTQKLILATKQLTEQNGGKYLLVTLANNEQVNFQVWQELVKNYPKLQISQVDLEKPDRLITQFCEENNLDCLAMLPYFQNYSKNNPQTSTHYKYDGHWNNVGTKLATEFLRLNLPTYLQLAKE